MLLLLLFVKVTMGVAIEFECVRAFKVEANLGSLLYIALPASIMLLLNNNNLHVHYF